MDVNDTRKAYLTNEVKLQKDTLTANILPSKDEVSSIEFSDEWTKNNLKFTNTKVEKIESTNLAELLDIPSGLQYDTINEKLSFKDKSISNVYSSSCKVEGSDTVSLSDIVSDIQVFETLDKINNFGDIFDFQFKQLDYGNFKYANVKSFVSFEKIIGYFSIDKLINDEQIRKKNQDLLAVQYSNTTNSANFKPYDGFLNDESYISNGWVSLDQIIRNIYKNDFAYDPEASIAIRTPKLEGAKRALITLVLGYVCDLFSLNSFNKLSDFGVRIVDRTTGKELSTTNIKYELIDKVANTLITTYSGKLDQPTEEANIEISENIEKNTSCSKVKTNKCNGDLFTVSATQNTNTDVAGFAHEIDVQVRLNPYRELLKLKPDILNTIDAIHWTTGIDELTKAGELFSLIAEFGENTYKSGRLNQDRAFSYSAGEFTNGIAAGGYYHNSSGIGISSLTESWNGIAWSSIGDCPINAACGLAGGNQDIAVISYGLSSQWTEEDATFDKFFKPSSNTINDTSAVYQNNTWITVDDISPQLPRHSVAGNISIKYKESTPGESIDQILKDEENPLCNEAISLAKQFASQTFNFSSESASTSGNIQVPNSNPKVWFNVWQCSGISFCGSNAEHLPLDSIRDMAPSITGITDEFESISWALVTKNTYDKESNEKISETQTFGCWFVDPIRKYPFKALGVKYVGTNSSGIATGGKTSKSLDNLVWDNAKVNMKNYFFDSSKFDLTNLSVTPHCYENNGISWIRREDLPEAVYYHTGVGDNEYAIFFGGMHASIENPLVYTSFKNCQDWESLINLYGGSFARNGSTSIDGNIRFSSFANRFDSYSVNSGDSFGNSYYKNKDSESPSSTVIYSEEYLQSGNNTVNDLYPDINKALKLQDVEFSFPNKQIHSNSIIKLTYNVNKRYVNIEQYKIVFDLVFTNNYINSFEDISYEPSNGTLTIFTDYTNVQHIKDYFNSIDSVNISIISEENIIKTKVFKNGVNRLIANNEESMSFHSDLNIFEEKLTRTNGDRFGKFTYYLSQHAKLFTEEYISENDSIPFGVCARKENYFSFLNPRYAGHPSVGGMWLVSRPTSTEKLYDPKTFLNNDITKQNIIDNGFNTNNPYTFFVNKAEYDVYNNDVFTNFKNIGLQNYISRKNSKYIFKELWKNQILPNYSLRIGGKYTVSRDGYVPKEYIEFSKLPLKGTTSTGYFINDSSEAVEVFISDQFISPEIVLPENEDDVIHINQYDNDNTGFLGKGFNRTSVIRDKAGLWPWVDLLQGDSTNSCKEGDYTFKWDLDGSLYFAIVEDSNDNNNEKYNNRTEKIRISKYKNNGTKIFDYVIEYKENIDNETFYDKGFISFTGEGDLSFKEWVASKKKEYSLYNVFGTEIKRLYLINDVENSLHIYGNKQNYETSDRTIISYNWNAVRSDEFDITDKTYPFKHVNLYEMLKSNDFYNSDDRYQVYLESYTFGKKSFELTPVESWYDPKYVRENNKVKNILLPQILSEDGCGIRENLIKERYNKIKVNPHYGVLLGDIRLIGESDPCFMNKNCSVLVCGDIPSFDPDYVASAGQPEYFLSKQTKDFNLSWKNTSIGTEFVSNIYDRLRRDGFGEKDITFNFLQDNGLTEYPITYKNGDVELTPIQIAKVEEIKGQTLLNVPNVVLFCAGIFDVMYDKNFYEIIYFLEEIAKEAQKDGTWFIFLTIPPRGMTQYDVAIERNVWYKNKVGDGTLDSPVLKVRVTTKDNPVSGEEWNKPMTFGPYQGLEDPFIGKTKLEKLVAINEWMKSKLTSYDHDVVDLYDFMVDKSKPAENQSKYIYNYTNNTINNTSGAVYGFIKSEYINEDHSNDEAGQYGGLISAFGNKEFINYVVSKVDLYPRFSLKILNFEPDTFINPVSIFNYLRPELAGKYTSGYHDLAKTHVNNTHLQSDKLTAYNISFDKENEPTISLKANSSYQFDLVHPEDYDSHYFNLLCCLLKQDTCYSACYSSLSDILGDDVKFKWKQHNHEEWTVPILESPFAGPFSTSEFNVWLASGDIKNTRWGTNIWASNEGGVITVHHRRQRVGISDPQSGYELVDGEWVETNSKSQRNMLYFTTITSEIRITNIEQIELFAPTPCRVFYDEFIYNLDAYENSEAKDIIKDIIKLSYPTYNNNELIPHEKTFNTKYEILGIDCNENSSAYRPSESQLNPYTSGQNLCNSESFTYSEWATNFVQEMKNNVGLRKLVDQKENKHFLKYNVNKPFGSSTYKNGNTVSLDPSVGIVETEWRRYQDGVGMGGDVPVLNTQDNKLICNNLNKWFIGQGSFGTPDKAVVFGGFEFPADGLNTASYLWWEKKTSDLTFKWNKFVINPEDTFNSNYSKRSFAPMFTNKEPTASKSSLGMITFDLTNKILVERQGTSIFNKVNNVSVEFDIPELIENKDKYSITLTASDNINCWYENKTTSGFVIKVDAEEWSGTIDWFITLNDRVKEDTNTDDPNKPYSTYEEI